jgi:hypothetical protein
MRWGIYARNEFEGAVAWRDGALAIGHDAELRSVSDYTPQQVESFDRIALFGLQGKGPMVLRDYERANVPVHVVDYGYVRRCNHAYEWRTGHWQVSLDGLNRPPKRPPNTSRFDALGAQLVERGGDPDGWVLLCPQTTGDASHGMDEARLNEWAREQASKNWGAPLLVRPHPLQEHLTYGLPVCPAPTLEAALAGARLVVTATSNVGHDALLAGVPVIATMPAMAAWGDLSGPELPSMVARRHHFARLGWGQWTWAEFRLGLPQVWAPKLS